jgi:hypothetical protein
VLFSWASATDDGMLVVHPVSPAHDPEPDTRCDDASVSAPQSRNGSGRWPRSVSGNPGGRPKGLARATREIVGEDGLALAQLWWDIARVVGHS